MLVDEERYNYLQSHIKIENEEIIAAIEYVLDSIETLCDDKFIIPSLNPKINHIVKELRETLVENQNTST